MKNKPMIDVIVLLQIHVVLTFVEPLDLKRNFLEIKRNWSICFVLPWTAVIQKLTPNPPATPIRCKNETLGDDGTGLPFARAYPT